MAGPLVILYEKNKNQKQTNGLPTDCGTFFISAEPRSLCWSHKSEVGLMHTGKPPLSGCRQADLRALSRAISLMSLKCGELREAPLAMRTGCLCILS